MSAEKPTFREAVNSLNGFEEVAIEKRFSMDIYTEGEERPARGMRAVLYVLFKREGDDDSAAYHKAMSLRSEAMTEYFSAEPDELMPDEPETEVGLGSSALESAPSSSPDSFSPPESSPASTRI